MTLCASCRSAVGEAMFLMVVRRASGSAWPVLARAIGHGSGLATAAIGSACRVGGRVGHAAVLNFVIVYLSELEPALREKRRGKLRT